MRLRQRVSSIWGFWSKKCFEVQGGGSWGFRLLDVVNRAPGLQFKIFRLGSSDFLFRRIRKRACPQRTSKVHTGKCLHSKLHTFRYSDTSHTTSHFLFLCIRFVEICLQQINVAQVVW